MQRKERNRKRIAEYSKGKNRVKKEETETERQRKTSDTRELFNTWKKKETKDEIAEKETNSVSNIDLEVNIRLNE